MKLAGPEKYEMTLTPESISVLCEKGSNRFSGLPTLTQNFDGLTIEDQGNVELV
jgi:hypothetical protein